VTPAEEDNSIPLLGDLFQGLSDLLGALGMIGADMTPEVRAKAQKVVLSAIIVTQVAQLATSSALAASKTTTVSRKVK